MARARLNPPPGRGDEPLDRGGVVRPRELFVLRLHAFHDGDGEELLVHGGVVVQDLSHLGRRAVEREVRGVAFLPEELTGAQERHRVFELPADDVVPLVETQGEVAVGADLLGVVWVHGGFAGGADGEARWELVFATEGVLVYACG